MLGTVKSWLESWKELLVAAPCNHNCFYNDTFLFKDIYFLIKNNFLLNLDNINKIKHQFKNKILKLEYLIELKYKII